MNIIYPISGCAEFEEWPPALLAHADSSETDSLSQQIYSCSIVPLICPVVLYSAAVCASCESLFNIPGQSSEATCTSEREPLFRFELGGGVQRWRLGSIFWTSTRSFVCLDLWWGAWCFR